VVVGCGSGSSDSESTAAQPSAGKGGASAAGSGGASGGGNAGSGGGVAVGGQGGSAAGTAGSAGATAGAAGEGGAAGASGQAGAGAAGEAGAAGSAGDGGAAGDAGAAGEAGAAGDAGQAGAAGSAGGCEGDPGLGAACLTGLQGVCAAGMNQCIQGVLSCVPAVGPGEQPEVCDGLDNDCDGEVDEGLPKTTFFLDADGDGVGSTATKEACAKPEGYSDKSTDCNDNNDKIFPGAEEVCNDTDDNCNGQVDEGVKKNTYFVDSDGDGYGSTATLQACALSPGLSDNSNDCNDNNKDIYPKAIELCNDADDNCNGVADEGVQKPTFYLDSDKDGYGGVASKFACSAPEGYVELPGDCNDFNKNIYPGAPEQCNNIDDDCNGLFDDDVVLLTIFKDNDGDGFAAQNAQSQQKCDVPVGFTIAKDVNGDGQPDWDCNDSEVKVYPGAPEVCGDGLDNSCSGVPDQLCFTACQGSWPFKLQNTYDRLDYTTIADLDGDGNQELITQENFGFAILDKTGAPRYNYSAPFHNYSRNRVVLGDIDTYDKFGNEIQNVEVLSGNGSIPRFYRLNADKTVTVFETHDLGPGSPVYDASSFMATDFDRDGTVEFVTSTWCEASGTKIVRFDRNSSTIKLVNTVADPDNTCEFYNGRSLTDLDGDGVPELVFSNGYPVSTTPVYWGGHTFATKFTSASTLTNQLFCPKGVCFDTDLPGLFGGGSYPPLFRFGDELRLGTYYFSSNTPNIDNPISSKFWRFDLAGNSLGNSDADNRFDGTTDIDDDGTPEGFSELAFLGFYDVNGDGRPDRIRANGTNLEVDLWDSAKKAFSNHAPSSFKVSTTDMAVHAAWDINNDGRLDVISADGQGNLFCHTLGPDTWNRHSSLPPHFPAYLRTHQWDNYEPNEGKDTNGDGVPDQVIQIPSALTAKGDFYSYLSSATDKDYYLVDSAYITDICVRAPKGRAYDLKVYAFADLWNNDTKVVPADGKPDGLIWESSSDAQTKCFSSTSVLPNRYGEFKFVIGIESSNGSFSRDWPYWISVKK
jgi:hypothetical protein